MSKVKMIKSRTNRAGQEVTLVYDQSYGFDRLLSNYQFIKDNKMVRGSGAWFYLDGLPNVKFQQKGFKAKLEESIELRQCFRELVMTAGEQFLSGARDSETVSVSDEASLKDMFASSLFDDIA